MRNVKLSYDDGRVLIWGWEYNFTDVGVSGYSFVVLWGWGYSVTNTVFINFVALDPKP